MRAIPTDAIISTLESTYDINFGTPTIKESAQASMRQDTEKKPEPISRSIKQQTAIEPSTEISCADLQGSVESFSE